MIDTKSMLAEVRANLRILDECPPPHDFQPEGGVYKFGCKWVCAKCGGRVDGHARHWYIAGLEHRGSPRGMHGEASAAPQAGQDGGRDG